MGEISVLPCSLLAELSTTKKKMTLDGPGIDLTVTYRKVSKGGSWQPEMSLLTGIPSITQISQKECTGPPFLWNCTPGEAREVMVNFKSLATNPAFVKNCPKPLHVQPLCQGELTEPFLQVVVSERAKELAMSLRSTGLVMKAIPADEAEGEFLLLGRGFDKFSGA